MPGPYTCSSMPTTYEFMAFDSSNDDSVETYSLPMSDGERLFLCIILRHAFAARHAGSWSASTIAVGT